jgi:hypothetical protein
MARLRTQRRPAPGQIWLSRPPYLMLAHVVEVNESRSPASITYELADDDGSVLHGPLDAVLDDGWWHAFQPLVRRWG